MNKDWEEEGVSLADISGEREDNQCKPLSYECVNLVCLRTGGDFRTLRIGVTRGE